MRHRPQRFAPIVVLGSLAIAIPSGAARQDPPPMQQTHRFSAPFSSLSVPREARLYAFLGGSDGATPYAGLIADETGALYGTTRNGGGSSMCPNAGCGTVFKLIPMGSGYVESVLYRFQGGSVGSGPTVGLIADKSGALYGTTSSGGGSPACTQPIRVVIGCGTVFKLTPAGSGYAESVLYRFRGGSDGRYPYAGLIADASGALYGTTVYGGVRPACREPGCGTVFKLTPAGSGYAESVLYRFQGRNDGRYPYAGLIADANGALFGTTVYGGGACSFSCGTVFKLTRSGSGYRETIVHSFQDRNDGATPFAGLIANKAGTLYGTTAGGGAGPCRCGTVFRLTPLGSGYAERILYSFQGGNDGTGPQAGLNLTDDALYGTTAGGGVYGYGIVFKLSL